MARGPSPTTTATAREGAKPSLVAGQEWSVLRKQVDNRLQQLDTYRYSWWVHWRDCADYVLPRRFKWLVTPNQWNKGSPINQRIVDATGTLAARTLASGMMSGITSPGRPWFRMTTTDDDLNSQSEVKLWMADCTLRMQRVMATSNYYTSKAVQYFDLAVFGSGPHLIFEDDITNGNVIRCFNPRAGEYYLAAGKNLDVDTLYYKVSRTVDEIVQEFGVEAVSDNVYRLYCNNQLDQEIVICMAMEKNPEHMPGFNPPAKTGVPRHWAWREVWWEYGTSNKGGLLRLQGYEDKPFSCPRWDAEGNDAYGRSPTMDALGDIKQLQLMTKRLAQAIDKMINPPMIADVNMKNEPASLLPGAITYVTTLTGGVGFKPAFTVTPPVQEMIKAIQDVQQRIKVTYFNDLFLMISQLQTVRSATEIDARREEKLVQLGPVLERFNDESLDPDINRIFRIMWRNGLLAPMPEALKGVSLKIEYVSVLADQQRASGTTAIERLVQLIGNISAAHQEALDKLDWDQLVDTYADLLLVPPKVLTSQQALKQLRGARQQKQTAETAMAVAGQGAEAAKTMSQTDLGGGQNALQMMFGGGMGLTPASPVAGNA